MAACKLHILINYDPRSDTYSCACGAVTRTGKDMQAKRR